MARIEPKEPWEVLTLMSGIDGYGKTYTSPVRVAHKDRMAWSKATAKKHARDFNERHHGKYAWAEPC